MITFGFLTLFPSQEDSYVTNIAKYSKDFNIQVYRFTPTSIDPVTENVHGEHYNCDKNKWEDSVFSIPAFIYDRCFYKDGHEHSKKSQPIVNWLKNRPSTTFLGHGLPNKWEIYQVLKNDSDITPYLPKTDRASSSIKLTKKLILDGQLLLKPTNGSMGNGICGLFFQRDRVEVILHKAKEKIQKEFTSKSELINWLDDLIKTRPYLYQPLLKLQDKEKRPFDIRILIQKNKHGAWNEIGRGIRRGHPENLISNVSAGGQIETFDSYIRRLSPIKQQLVIENINSIIAKLPRLLEFSFGPLFEIGLDLGVAEDNSVWILDTNSKPGRKVIATTAPSLREKLYCAPLQYCLHLSNKGVEQK